MAQFVQLYRHAVPILVLLLGSSVLPAEVKRVKASDQAQLTQLIGRQVAVYGQITSTGKSKSGHHFLNFSNRNFGVVCRSSFVQKFDGKGPAELYKNKRVEIKGKIERYQKRLQIQLQSPDQIKILKPAKAATIAPIKLRKIGSNTWISPAGIKYAGKDSEGKTRVEHILRHAYDMPSRPGPHGVFDGGREVALAWVDAAWKRAQAKKIPRRREGRNSTLLVSMGRPVGYLGGRTGATRGRPKLSRILLVFRGDTKEIITAYPK